MSYKENSFKTRVVKYFITLLMILIPSMVFADADPIRVDSVNGCIKYTFCDAQTATGDCTTLPASGDERVLRAMGRSRITYYSLQSVGAHVCDIISNDQGHDAASGAGQKINAVSLTASTAILTLSAPFDYVWITCPTVGTSVTVSAVVCAGNN